MEMLTLRIPLDFIEAKLGGLTWREALFGLENQLIDPKAVSQLAVAGLDQLDPPPALIDLATSHSGEPTLHHVRQLAELEPTRSNSLSARKWLYLVLAWLFEHRGELPDPLQSVESVYAEFDYPDKLADFVRYMPSDDPDLGDPQLNEDRLIGRWERYLAEEQAQLTQGCW